MCHQLHALADLPSANELVVQFRLKTGWGGRHRGLYMVAIVYQ
jgi:hypothetical protein